MCGIAGYINLNGHASEEVIRQMTDAIAHRGPDGFGHKIADNIAIGHRRLSIIDLESGAQPMSDNSGKIWITYNGELYNYKEIKERLTGSGYVFKTSSDTEVIIYAYREWGERCLEHFRGMFAFAIMDLETKKLFIARDHFGIKPLFYYQSGDIIAFGSELQQFRKLPGFNKEIDLNAIDQYLWLQYIPAPLTVFKSIRKLKAAHYITIDFSGNISNQIPYWDLDFSKKKVRTEKEWVEATEHVIKNSVKAHLVSDVPFGAFLSGGIDSSLVVGYMSEVLNKKVETFSIGFEEEEYNELKYSEVVAKKFGTNHHVEIVKPDALHVLPKLVQHYGEPFGDSSAIPTYYVCELARKHVTMVLSGDGGDEGFAGYNTYTQYMRYMPVNFRTGIKKKLFPYAEMLFPKRYPKYDTLNTWLSYMSYLQKDWRTKLWNKEYHQYISDMPTGFQEIYNKAKSCSKVNKVQYLDMKTYMNFDILTKVDTASMIHSLEVRTPLIDKEVWEFAASIPEEFNINNRSGEWRGKLLLKGILMKHFPAEFIHRRKQGFGVPISRWFSHEGELNGLLQDRILSQNSLIRTYFDQNVIHELISKNHSGALWLILFLEEWLTQYEKS
ncbi:MAG: asparagine synthase (glutamine-hydrolyzing) [Bacteroidetes bacterium]|nr:asparagine synthase (glutamine-hydrolyzing) [Bacteroidota bacterium]